MFERQHNYLGGKVNPTPFERGSHKQIDENPSGFWNPPSSLEVRTPIRGSIS